MRALIRRVCSAEVRVDSIKVGTIGNGLVIYLGVHQEDSVADINWIVKKVLGLRIFEDDNRKMNKAIGFDQGILLISQFTLWGKVRMPVALHWCARAKRVAWIW